MIKDRKLIQGCEIKHFHCVGTPLQLKIYCNKNKEYASNLRVCFDLDNTLVTHPVVSGDYSSVLPIQRNINFLKLLHTLGNTIIIYTARRMKTHKGNIGAIVADVGRVTLDTWQTAYYSSSLFINSANDKEASLVWYSINHLYYKRAGRPFETFGYADPAVIERTVFDEASIISILTATATELFNTADSIATPCSVNTKGKYRLPPCISLEVTICDLKFCISSSDNWIRNDSGNRSELRLTA
jgi:hypothetical protein